MPRMGGAVKVRPQPQTTLVMRTAPPRRVHRERAARRRTKVVNLQVVDLRGALPRDRLRVPSGLRTAIAPPPGWQGIKAQTDAEFAIQVVAAVSLGKALGIM